MYCGWMEWTGASQLHAHRLNVEVPDHSCSPARGTALRPMRMTEHAWYRLAESRANSVDALCGALRTQSSRVRNNLCQHCRLMRCTRLCNLEAVTRSMCRSSTSWTVSERSLATSNLR